MFTGLVLTVVNRAAFNDKRKNQKKGKRKLHITAEQNEETNDQRDQKQPKATSLHTAESLQRSCQDELVFFPIRSRMLATVFGWLTDFLTGAIMESRKAARSKAVASHPGLLDARDTQE